MKRNAFHDKLKFLLFFFLYFLFFFLMNNMADLFYLQFVHFCHNMGMIDRNFRLKLHWFRALTVTPELLWIKHHRTTNFALKYAGFKNTSMCRRAVWNMLGTYAYMYKHVPRHILTYRNGWQSFLFVLKTRGYV